MTRNRIHYPMTAVVVAVGMSAATAADLTNHPTVPAPAQLETLVAVPAPDTVSAFESKADIPFQRLDEYFKNPPMVYRMIQYGHPRNREELQKLKAYGIGGLQWAADEKNGWKDYLNPKALANYSNEVQMARAEGFHLWIHDESGYPSGMAGGLVVEGNPEYELRCVYRLKQAGRGQKAVTIALPAGAEKFICGVVYPVMNGEPDFSLGTAAQVTPLRVSTPGQEGDWILCAFAQVVVSEGGPGEGTAQQFVNSGKYPNTLDANAVAKFMEITHERYAHALGGLRGKVDGFYTGEPSLGSPIWTSAPRSNDLAYLPWHTDLIDLFRTRNGYELLPNMGALFEGESDQAKLVRFHFYRLVAETLAERYFGRIGRWCKANGVQLMVQTLQEEEIDKHVINEGDIMLAESQAQVPGLDFPVPMGNFENYDDVWMPKFISSSALLNRRETVMGLVDPIIGGQKPPYAPPIPDLRWVINMTSAMGVNQFST